MAVVELGPGRDLVAEQLPAASAAIIVLLGTTVVGVETGVATASAAATTAAAAAAEAAAAKAAAPAEASAKARRAAWAEATTARGAAAGWAASPIGRASATRWSTKAAAVVASRISSVATAAVSVGGCRRCAARWGAFGATVAGPGVARSPGVLPLKLGLELLSFEHKARERLAECLHTAAELRLESDVLAQVADSSAEVALRAEALRLLLGSLGSNTKECEVKLVAALLEACCVDRSAGLGRYHPCRGGCKATGGVQ
jgi:hypothetical protein